MAFYTCMVLLFVLGLACLAYAVASFRDCDSFADMFSGVIMTVAGLAVCVCAVVMTVNAN